MGKSSEQPGHQALRADELDVAACEALMERAEKSVVHALTGNKARGAAARCDHVCGELPTRASTAGAGNFSSHTALANDSGQSRCVQSETLGTSSLTNPIAAGDLFPHRSNRERATRPVLIWSGRRDTYRLS